MYQISVLLRDGIIVGLSTEDETAQARKVIDARGTYVFPGLDADFVLVDLDLKKKVDAADFPSAYDYSPWEGWGLKG